MRRPSTTRASPSTVDRASEPAGRAVEARAAGRGPSGSVRSLTATTSRSVSRSSRARSTLRPMRPNPLMAMRVMGVVPFVPSGTPRASAIRQHVGSGRSDSMRKDHATLHPSLQRSPDAATQRSTGTNATSRSTPASATAVMTVQTGCRRRSVGDPGFSSRMPRGVVGVPRDVAVPEHEHVDRGATGPAARVAAGSGVTGAEAGVRGIHSQFAAGRRPRLVHDPEPHPVGLEPRELGQPCPQRRPVVVADHARRAAPPAPRSRRAWRRRPSRRRAPRRPRSRSRATRRRAAAAPARGRACRR